MEDHLFYHFSTHFWIFLALFRKESGLRLVFVGIAAYNFTTPEVDDETVAEAVRWRRWSGHAYAEYSGVGRESLVQRVCALDKSLQTSGIQAEIIRNQAFWAFKVHRRHPKAHLFHGFFSMFFHICPSLFLHFGASHPFRMQVALYENIGKYLKPEAQGWEVFFTGPVLCMVALLCWYLMVAKEVSHALALHRGIMAVPMGPTRASKASAGPGLDILDLLDLLDFSWPEAAFQALFDGFSPSFRWFPSDVWLERGIDSRENPFTCAIHYRLRAVPRRRKTYSFILLLYRLAIAGMLLFDAWIERNPMRNGRKPASFTPFAGPLGWRKGSKDGRQRPG